MNVALDQHIKLADVLNQDDRGLRFEVIQGEWAQMSPVGIEHAAIVNRVYGLLAAYAREKRLGYVFGDSLIYILHEEDDDTVREARIPDVSFLRKERLSPDMDLQRPFAGSPDLVVEVVSPSESAADVLDKVQSYLHYGTEQVWVLYPRQKMVHQYDRLKPAEVRIYHQEDVLTLLSILPGFSICTGDFFTLEWLE